MPQRASLYRGPFSSHNLSFECQGERTKASLSCSAALPRHYETCRYTCCLQFRESCSESTRTVRPMIHKAGPHRTTIQLWGCTALGGGPCRWEMPAACQHWHSYRNQVQDWRCKWGLGTLLESPTLSRSWWLRIRDLRSSLRPMAWHPFCWWCFGTVNSTQVPIASRLLSTILA